MFDPAEEDWKKISSRLGALSHIWGRSTPGNHEDPPQTAEEKGHASVLGWDFQCPVFQPGEHAPYIVAMRALDVLRPFLADQNMDPIAGKTPRDIAFMILAGEMPVPLPSPGDRLWSDEQKKTLLVMAADQNVDGVRPFLSPLDPPFGGWEFDWKTPGERRPRGF